MSISDPCGTESIFQPAELSALSPAALEPNSDGCVNVPGLVMMSWSSSAISQPLLPPSSPDSDFFSFFFFGQMQCFKVKQACLHENCKGGSRMLARYCKNRKSRSYCETLNYSPQMFLKTRQWHFFLWSFHPIQIPRMIEGTRKLVNVIHHDCTSTYQPWFYEDVLLAIFQRLHDTAVMPVGSYPTS